MTETSEINLPSSSHSINHQTMKTILEWLMKTILEWLMKTILEWLMKTILEWVMKTILEWLIETIIEWLMKKLQFFYSWSLVSTPRTSQLSPTEVSLIWKRHYINSMTHAHIHSTCIHTKSLNAYIHTWLNRHTIHNMHTHIIYTNIWHISTYIHTKHIHNYV